MNKGAIVRIIIWGLVALLLIGVLVFFLAAGRNPWEGRTDNGTRGGFQHADASPDGAASPSAVTGLSDIREIEIEWTRGGVEIVPTDGELRFYEDYSGEEKYQMVYRVDGHTLKIDTMQESAFSFFSIHNPVKTLTVELPRSTFDRIDIETVSADIDMRGVTASSLDLEAVSGGIVLSNCDVTELDVSDVSGSIEGDALSCDEAEIESVSGKIALSLTRCRTLDSETVSGRMELTVLDQLQKAELSTTSGEMLLAVPDGLAANVTWNAVSGSLQNSAVGASAVQVHADSVSGDFTIENAEKVTP